MGGIHDEKEIMACRHYCFDWLWDVLSVDQLAGFTLRKRGQCKTLGISSDGKYVVSAHRWKYDKKKDKTKLVLWDLDKREKKSHCRRCEYGQRLFYSQ